MSFCGSTGSRNSQLALIGEAPGRQELLHNPPMPYVGPSGNLLWLLAKRNGFSRDECYCTNVIKQSAPSSPLLSMSENELLKWRDILRNELNNTKCNLYVAMGNTALWAIASDEISQSLVTENKYEKTGISDWRGSMLKAWNGRKLIPTLHPAGILRGPQSLYLLERDMQLISEERKFPEINIPQVNYHTRPSLPQALDYILKCRQSREFAFDIETNTNITTCVSLAYRPDEAMSIPMQGIKYWSPEQYWIIVQALNKLLQSEDCLKIGQNISYDIIGLSCVVRVKPPIYDIMHMYHALDPGVVNEGSRGRTVLHSLASQASRFTRHPFWKAWDVVPDNSGQTKNLYEYNCHDSAVTLELKRHYDKAPKHIQDFYKDNYQSIQPWLIEMYEDGLCIDKQLQEQLAKQYYEDADQIEQQTCENLFGLSAPNYNFNSSPQLCKMLYDDLHLPIQYNRKGYTRIRTADDDALIQLYLETQNNAILKIRDVKEKRKLASFMVPKDKKALRKRQTWDGRFRCEYKLTTGTGRTASAGSLATGIGINLQNIPGAVRRTIIPAPGYIFIEPDYMQAEARVIAYDALDFKYMDLFSRPDDFDMHWYNAEIIMARPRNGLLDIDRDCCKHIVFGSFYDMKERKLQETILKYTDPPFFLPLSICRLRQDIFKSQVPTFLQRQERIRNEVLSTGRQISPTGRIVTYHEVIIDNDLKYCFGRRDYNEVFRSAYSMIPQDVVRFLVNRGLAVTHYELKSKGLGRVAAQVHDSGLIEVLDNEQSVLEAFRISRKHLEQPIMIRGHELSIPTDYKIGYNWLGERKKIRTEEQLIQAYREIKR